MDGITVYRVIPGEFLDKIAAGIHRVDGGVVRDSVTGRIVAHLQFRGPEAIQSLGTPFQSLFKATIALDGMNLAVSATGFAVVVAKLNQMNKKLIEVIEKLDRIYYEILRLQRQLERESRSKLIASLENLALGLRINDSQIISLALGNMNESAKFYSAFSKELLENVSQVYFNPAPFRMCLEMSFAAHFARAHALALRNHPEESFRLMDDLKEWQDGYRRVLEAPLSSDPKPLWLARLSSEQKNECRELVHWVRQIPEGIDYARNQYQLCLDHGFTPDYLAQLTEKDDVVALVPVEKNLDTSSQEGRG